MASFLIDTNVLIAAEPTAPEHVEATTEQIALFVGLASRSKADVFLHPATTQELAGDRDPDRRRIRSHLLAKYQELPAPPEPTPGMVATLGPFKSGTHDAIDALMLAAVVRDAVEFLVTSDQGIHRWARQIGVADRVLSPADAVGILQESSGESVGFFPSVEFVYCHELPDDPAFFSSLQNDYPGFDSWLQKAKHEHRRAFCVSDHGKLAGLVIVKGEDGGRLLIEGPVLKICTFKISEQHRGNRFGELLLKAVFDFCWNQKYAAAYLTVFPKHEMLIDLLQDFGFSAAEKQGEELVLTKDFRPSSHDYSSLDPLAYHRAFGPYHVKVPDRDVFVVPIEPRWHRALFPELDAQKGLFGSTPYGNSIRKAYLCRSNQKAVNPGSVLLFYRSGDLRSVQAIGVAEYSMRESDPLRLKQAVAARTVYSDEAIHGLTSTASNGVLAILFRQARTIEPATLSQLKEARVLRAHPQSITRVRPEGLPWLKRLLET